MSFLLLGWVLFIGIIFGIAYSNKIVQKEIDLRKKWQSIAKKLIYNKQFTGSKIRELWGQYRIIVNPNEQECIDVLKFIRWMDEKNEKNIEL
jgi:hypothetical protein